MPGMFTLRRLLAPAIERFTVPVASACVTVAVPVKAPQAACATASDPQRKAIATAPRTTALRRLGSPAAGLAISSLRPARWRDASAAPFTWLGFDRFGRPLKAPAKGERQISHPARRGARDRIGARLIRGSGGSVYGTGPMTLRM